MSCMVSSFSLLSAVFVLFLVFCGLTSLCVGIEVLQRFHIFGVDDEVSDKRTVVENYVKGRHSFL
jgi:hypothetical protein